MFKVYRHAQGESKRTPKRRLSLRKGVADIPLRAQVSQDINHRFETQLATLQTNTSLQEVIAGLCKGRMQSGRRIRGLDITGKDRGLLLALSDSSFELSGITNKALRQKLSGQMGFRHLTDKQLSAKVSRQLRLLRDQGLIRKYPRQRKYGLTTKGRQLTIAVPALLNASVKELMEIAA